MKVLTKRVYDPPAPSDGYRVLVDRMWPRGLKKAEAHLDQWQRDLAPSNELRQWFAHDPAKWVEFCRRYAGELDHKRAVTKELLEKARAGTVCLVYAAKDEAHNNAVALRKYLVER